MAWKMMDGYEMVIGLEVHVELKTKTKIFCACPTTFGAAPNTQCCPVCMGFPGTLPVLNRQVVHYAVLAGLATGCTIARYSKQDRKNYFYPDLPKAYQISQYDLPLCVGGHLTVETEAGEKRIGITRIHTEEDAGKMIHIGGDECPKDSWKQCPLCQERIRTEGLKDEFELQSYTVRRMEKWLREHGRKIIGWDEILEGGVSPTATVMSWRGSKGGIAAAKAGNHVIMAPNVHCYLDYYQTKTPTKEPMAIGGYVPMRKVYELDPYDQLTPGERAYILGVQGNLWTEYIATFPHLKHMLLPRLAAIAEVGWSYDRKDFDDFKHRMNSLRKCYDAAGLNYATYFFEGKDE